MIWKKYFLGTDKMERKQNGSILLLVIILMLIMLLFSFYMIEHHSLSILIYKRNEQLMQSENIAQEGLKILLERQNKDSNYFFNKDNYDKLTEDFAVFKPIEIMDQNKEILGKASIKIIPNPIIYAQSKYDIEIEALHLPSHSKQIITAKISAIHFQEYQYFSEEEVNINSKEIFGKIYSPYIYISEEQVDFWNIVEYLKSIINEEKGIYYAPKHQLAKPYLALNKIINIHHLKEATQKSFICGDGIGFYIGKEGSSDYTEIINKHFRRDDSSYQIDLGKIKCNDASKFISYNNEVLPRFDGSNSAFNGIIYVEGDVHIWGILGGPSEEDFFIIDKNENTEKLYPGPDGIGNNKYSNNMLDKGEDLNNDGYLEPSNKGCNLLIVSGQGFSIIIDHNIFQPSYPNWKENKLFLISGGIIQLASYSPKTTIIEASMIAMQKFNGFSFIVENSQSGRLKNYWAKNSDAAYIYDLNANSLLETNNGEGEPEDRNEFNVVNASSLIIRGNLILKGKADFEEYNHHIIKLIYDEQLNHQHPRCYPYIPIWKYLTGSFKIKENDFIEEENE